MNFRMFFVPLDVALLVAARRVPPRPPVPRPHGRSYDSAGIYFHPSRGSVMTQLMGINVKTGAGDEAGPAA